MPVSSPAYKTLCFTLDGRGVALSLNKGVIEVNALLDEVKAFDNHLITLVLSQTAPLLVRPLLLPLKTPSEIDQALPHEVEGLFSTQQGDVVFDRILHPVEKGKRRVTLIITTTPGLQESLKPFEELGLVAEGVTAAPVCLATAAHAVSPTDVPRGVLLAHQEASLFIVEKGGALLGAVKLPHPLQKGSLARAISSLTRELQTPIAKEILTFSKELVVAPPEPYVFVSPPEIYGLTENNWEKFVLPFGGAVGSLVGKTNGINLREKRLQPPLPWKRTSPRLFLLASAFLLALSALFIAGVSYLSWKEDLLREKWAFTLSLLGKSEEQFEEHFIEKGGGRATDLALLSPRDIVARAHFVQKDLASTPILFPLHPNVPKVTDLLAWFATLDEVVGEEERLQITSLQYSMVKRPEMEKKQEKYQVKVDLEFTTPSPKWAREFHDLLINPNPFVDPKGEVKWNVTRGSYKTSFLLKDQTAYVH